MRVLGIGSYHDLGSLYLDLIAHGHEVRVHVEDEDAHDILAGLVPRCADWRSELPWIRAVGRDGIIVFEGADQGPLQDDLRRQGYQVIGGSAYGDLLETDRAAGQEAMRAVGMRTAPYATFPSAAAAAEHIRSQPGRYVYKASSTALPSGHNSIGQQADGADVLALLERYARRGGAASGACILMPYLEGVECGVGAYFDGRRFIAPACLDWEHKRFFTGDLGELTGEMGTLVTYEHAGPIFAATLQRMEPLLAEHGYLGYININTIINEAGIWPLEFTCRFGYPGYAILEELQRDDWGAIFARLLGQGDRPLRVHPGFAVGVVLTVPPFPYLDGYDRLSKGLPIHIAAPASERAHFHLGEVSMQDGGLVTAGMVGYAMVVTGRGRSVAAARCRAYRRCRQVSVPNLRYRLDIGRRFQRRDRAALVRLGYWPGGA
jgi:phosphoribosylamine--glycine ligase